MEHHRTAGHGFGVGAFVEQVGLEQFQCTRRLLLQFFEVRNLIGIVRVTHGGVHGDAGIEQVFYNPAGDIAGGTGHQYRLIRVYGHVIGHKNLS